MWENNFKHVEQLFNYGSAVRKVMYTTNAIESVNSSFRKVTKKVFFPNDMAVYKIFYLRILELYKKWDLHKLIDTPKRTGDSQSYNGKVSPYE